MASSKGSILPGSRRGHCGRQRDGVFSGEGWWLGLQTIVIGGTANFVKPQERPGQLIEVPRLPSSTSTRRLPDLEIENSSGVTTAVNSLVHSQVFSA
jgi:hypothetical protein